MFESFVRHRFKDLPGARMVTQGRYCIRLNGNQQATVTNESWSRQVFPGTVLQMAVILPSVRLNAGECPRPGCSHRMQIHLDIAGKYKWLAGAILST